MTTSTNESGALTEGETGGAFADALTLVRFLVTPIIMALIIWQWPDPQVAILARFLFIIGALTDIFDDYFGGSASSATRRFGYLDDAADTVLIMGVLIALSFVLWRNGLFLWPFAVPVCVLIAREVIVGLVKGYELSRFGVPVSPLSILKSASAMLGTVLLVGSPWLTQVLDRFRADADNVMDVYNAASPDIWLAGQSALWIAMVFSLLSGYRRLTYKRLDEGQ